jgi:nicotinate phosphoribosyltransferase
MAYAYWSEGRTENYAVFDLFFRKNPFKGEFCVFAGLQEVIRFVESFRYEKDPPSCPH